MASVRPTCDCSFLVRVYEKELSHMSKNIGNPDLVCQKGFLLNWSNNHQGAPYIHYIIENRLDWNRVICAIGNAAGRNN